MSSHDDNNALYAKREKIQNRWVTGFYQRIRLITTWLTVGWFFAAPWFTWHGRQAILFDVADRKFYLFGLTFWPQDFFLLLCLFIIAALGLIIVTNLAGRIWCGYTCPQTVWTRLFMWIEYMTEGDRNKRLKRDQHPWELSTLIRRCLKHFFWLLLAFITALGFVAYFVPVKMLLMDLLSCHGDITAILWLGFFTLATYLNAGWMREQFCLHMCPYARFQSVMFDKNTLVISYDYHRGEPRGARKKNELKTLGKGDCIDCQLCVQVCPTGIDIRQGLQLGCIGCAACVDVCNDVMKKMQYSPGLIRYSTDNALEKKPTVLLRVSLLVSVVILTIMVSIFSYALVTRVPLQIDVLHDHKNLYRMTAMGNVENTYVLKILNMSQASRTYAVQLLKKDNIHYIGPQQITLQAGEIISVPVTLTSKIGVIKQFNTPINFSVTDVQENRIKLIGKTNFFSPQGK